MNVDVQPGKYIIAVSGGVDSMVLLHVLASLPQYELIVAHYDHGIRHDSHIDRELVQSVAAQNRLPFVYEEGALGAVSEAAAREARYDFLRKVQKLHAAQAIITAHHQDDLLETAFINLLRGTGRRGLTSLRDNDDIKRPLLKYAKQDLQSFAELHNVSWREDSTNASTDYLRNYVRKHVVSKLQPQQRITLLSNIQRIQQVNDELDLEIANYLHLKDRLTLERTAIILLNHYEACEVMASWLRMNEIREFNKQTIQQLVIMAKVSRPGKRIPLNNKNNLEIHDTSLVISSV